MLRHLHAKKSSARNFPNSEYFFEKVCTEGFGSAEELPSERFFVEEPFNLFHKAGMAMERDRSRRSITGNEDISWRSVFGIF